MEKRFVSVTYWLGLASTVIALVMRTLNAVGMLLPPATAKAGETIWYMSFYKGALLFFLVAIATSGSAAVILPRPKNIKVAHTNILEPVDSAKYLRVTLTYVLG